MGSPAFAVPTLRALVEGSHDVVGVVTQPDRPAGRGRAWTPPPAKVFALERGLHVLQPVDVSSPPSVERLRALEPDVIVVAAYGQILRRAVLDIPKRGSLNVHASLLPYHRGASPLAAAILAGDEVTGVSIMEVVRALDAGPVVARIEEAISLFDTTGALEERLAEKGARLLADILDDWAERRIEAEPQDDSLATYAPMIKRSDAKIDWSLSAEDIWRRVRAYNPWPVAHTYWRGAELRVWEAWPADHDRQGQPGTVYQPESVSVGGRDVETFLVQTGRGVLAVLQVQRTGKRVLAGIEFLRGQRNLIGEVLGE